MRWALGGLMLAGGLALAAIMLIFIGLAFAYPKLPDISGLTDYQPKLPLRIYTADDKLMAEYGQERRQLVPIEDIPEVMIDAVLATEDARFYEHSGIDYIGVARAALANLDRQKSQGASTITMQVARNTYLSKQKTYTRKIYEMLLTLKLEHLLSKSQILEVYMNQIFLGHRAYGFASAAHTYFGKDLQDISLAEAAMLAGIPKSPSTSNPITNLKRAKARQHHVLDRMVENQFISAAQAEQAKDEEIKIQRRRVGSNVHAEYAAEMVRQIVVAQYGEETYTRGLKVYTSIDSQQQENAYNALRNGILNFERRQRWRGPEEYLDWPQDAQEQQDLIEQTLAELPDTDDILAAIVTAVQPGKVTASLKNGDSIELQGNGLLAMQSGLVAQASNDIRIRPGAVIRVEKKQQQWLSVQMPEVEGALVALDPKTGQVTALVGGFDFNKNNFNHVTQAWRQPGSSFKPFIYSAALEKGFMPSTVIDDAPISFPTRGGKTWTPKNYEGGFQGPMSMRLALMRSRNIISVKILQQITPGFGQQWAARFGFDASKHPAYLPMALGSGSVTPLQMAAGFATFANGGWRVEPALITRITDHNGNTLLQSTPPTLAHAKRAISERNAFIMDSMLQDVTRSGTAAKARAQLGRNDIAGKTGTTNNAYDAWFVGYQHDLAAAVWIGYDTPRNLGTRETGGGLALPIWINFMRTALQDVPQHKTSVPDGLIRVNNDWAYREYASGSGIRNLHGAGLQPEEPEIKRPTEKMPTRDRNRILDMFRD